MNQWKRLVAMAAAMSMLAGMTACGGDGDGGGGGGGGSGGLEKVEASQQAAEGMVEEVNELVLELRSAEASSQVPTGAHISALPIGATVEGSMQCSDLGTSGSGTLSYVYTYQGDKPVSWVYSYNDCTYTISGFTYHMDGTFSMTYSSYTNSENFRYTYVYDLDYEYTSESYSGSHSITARQSCVMSGGNLTCTHQTSSGEYNLGSWDIDIDGDTITVVNATIVGKNVTIVFDDWVFDSSTGRALSGTVQVTDKNGNSALLTATGDGYSVEVTVNGASSTWNVTY